MRLALAVAVGLVLSASPVQAAVLPGQTLDGPGTVNLSLQDVSLAADGTGAVAYIKEDGGADQAFVVRRSGGAWGAPVKVSNSVADVTSVQAEASNGGRLLVVYLVAGDLTARVSPGTGQLFGGFLPATTNILGFDSDANDAGTGFIFGASNGGDVGAFRVTGNTLTPMPPILDSTGTNVAGDTDRAISVDGAGNAIAAWNEAVGGSTNIFARRISGANVHGPAVQATVPSFNGKTRGTGSQNVDVESDLSGNAWVSLREQFDYGFATNRNRPLVRRLSGNAFGPPLLVDPGPEPPLDQTDAEFTRLAVAPNGANVLASGFIQNNNTNKPPVFGASLTSAAASPFLLEAAPSDGAIRSANGLVNGGSGFIAYSFQPGAAANYVVRARLRSGTGAFGAPIAVSNPALGQVDGASTPFAAADASKTGVVAYSQGAAAQKRILVATLDLPLPVAGGGDKLAPAISRVSLSRRTFRKGSKLPKLSARKFKTGTTIRFRLSEAATVRLTFEKAAKGRKVGKRCRKPSRKNRKRKRCTRYVRVKTALTVRGKAGANKLSFQGRLTRRRSLKTGRYRFSMRATDAARNASKPTAKKRFRLLAAAKKKKKKR